LPVVRVTGEDRHRPLVVAGTLIGVPAARVARAVVEQVQRRIVGIPAPRGPAAARPLVALPGADAEVLAAVRRVVRVGIADDLDVGVRARRIRAPHFLAAVHVVRRHATGFASGGWAGTCFQIIGAPSLVRSSANTMFGNALCTYITVPITSGFPSWPFSTPVENVQVALRFFTFALLIAVSGLYRCRSG